jgi:hypothetical protein
MVETRSRLRTRSDLSRESLAASDDEADTTARSPSSARERKSGAGTVCSNREKPVPSTQKADNAADALLTDGSVSTQDASASKTSGISSPKDKNTKLNNDVTISEAKPSSEPLETRRSATGNSTSQKKKPKNTPLTPKNELTHFIPGYTAPMKLSSSTSTFRTTASCNLAPPAYISAPTATCYNRPLLLMPEPLGSECVAPP